MTPLVPEPVILRVVRVIERVNEGLEASDGGLLREFVFGHIETLLHAIGGVTVLPRASRATRGEGIQVDQRLCSVAPNTTPVGHGVPDVCVVPGCYWCSKVLA